MPNHPAIAPGRTAVITGGASGIGLAAAKRYAELEMNVCIADVDVESLQTAASEIAAASPRGKEAVIAVETDVSQIDQVARLKQQAYDRFGEVAVLMNNAGTGPGGERRRKIAKIVPICPATSTLPEPSRGSVAMMYFPSSPPGTA